MGACRYHAIAAQFEVSLARVQRAFSAWMGRRFADGSPVDESALFAAPPAGPPQSVRVAGIVLKWIRGDKEANFRRVEPMIREAAAGAKIVCTTECFLDGYAIADKSIPLDTYRALGEPIPDGEYFQRLAKLADELKIHLICRHARSRRRGALQHGRAARSRRASWSASIASRSWGTNWCATRRATRRRSSKRPTASWA